MSEKEAKSRREPQWRSPRAKANFVHNFAFLSAVLLQHPWNAIGLAGLVLTLLIQLRVWGHPLGESVGQAGGVMLAMWLVRVTGYRNDAGANVGLAVLIVATEVIVAMIATSLARWRRERLTPPGTGS